MKKWRAGLFGFGIGFCVLGAAAGSEVWTVADVMDQLSERQREMKKPFWTTAPTTGFGN